MFARAFGGSPQLVCARATRFGANLCLARLMSPDRVCTLECTALPITWMGPGLAAGIGGPSRAARATTGAKVRLPPRPQVPQLASPMRAQQDSTVSHVCFMLTVRRRRAPPPTAPLLPPPSPHLRRIYRVCSRVWAVVLGRLRARALCNVCVPLEGPAGLWAASGGQKGRGVRSFRLPRSRWTWAGPLGRLGRLGTRLGRSELHSRACL